MEHLPADPSTDPDLVAVQENEQVLGVMLALHGAVHLVGLFLTWQWFEPRGFAYDDVWPDAGTGGARLVGIGWLVVAAAIGVVGVRMANGRPTSRRLLVAVHAGSIAVCLTALPAAVPGLVISTTLIGAVVVLAIRRRQVLRG